MIPTQRVFGRKYLVRSVGLIVSFGPFLPFIVFFCRCGAARQRRHSLRMLDLVTGELTQRGRSVNLLRLRQWLL